MTDHSTITTIMPMATHAELAHAIAIIENCALRLMRGMVWHHNMTMRDAQTCVAAMLESVGENFAPYQKI